MRDLVERKGGLGTGSHEKMGTEAIFPHPRYSPSQDNQLNGNDRLHPAVPTSEGADPERGRDVIPIPVFMQYNRRIGFKSLFRARQEPVPGKGIDRFGTAA